MKKLILCTVLTLIVFLCLPTAKDIWSNGSSSPAAAPIDAGTAALSELPGDIMMLGDSITAAQNMTDLFGIPIQNKGVAGFATGNVIKNFDNLFRGTPDKVFILLGINDILQSVEKDQFLENYRAIINRIKSQSPTSKIYILSILPTMSPKLNAQIIDFNIGLMKISVEQKAVYVDLYGNFIDGPLVNSNYVTDGIHLSSKGYEVFKDVLSRRL